MNKKEIGKKNLFRKWEAQSEFLITKSDKKNQRVIKNTPKKKEKVR